MSLDNATPETDATPEIVDETSLRPTSPGAVKRVILPSGAWVDLRDSKNLVAKDRKRILAQMDDNKTLGTNAIEIGDGIVALLVVGWSYPLPIPSVSIESLDALPLGDESALLEEPLIDATRKLVFPDTKDNPGEVHPDPSRRTGRFAG